MYRQTDTDRLELRQTDRSHFFWTRGGGLGLGPSRRLGLLSEDSRLGIVFLHWFLNYYYVFFYLRPRSKWVDFFFYSSQGFKVICHCSYKIWLEIASPFSSVVWLFNNYYYHYWQSSSISRCQASPMCQLSGNLDNLSRLCFFLFVFFFFFLLFPSVGWYQAVLGNTFMVV